MSGKQTKPLMERFNEKWRLNEDTGCWVWRGNVLSDGYGGIWRDGLMKRAHRISYELYKSAPRGFVCHHCDNPLCVNPDHLFEGTHKDNMEDMRRKNRGDKNKIKLTPRSVLMIRNSGEPNEVLAERYGVHKSHIWRIKTKRSWGHL